MSKPVVLQDRFTGIWRDSPQDQLPPGKAWTLIDWLPGTAGRFLQKRGGFGEQGTLLSSLDASATWATRVIVAPFSVGTQILAVDGRADSQLFDLTGAVDRGSIYGASADQPLSQPVFWRDMVIFPTAQTAASSAPRKYVAAGTISDLGGSPPDFSFATVHADRLAVVRVDNPERIQFSHPGTPESHAILGNWDADRFMDANGAVVALASLRNALIVFHAGSVERIRGKIPPGSAATDMELEPLFGEVGLIDSDALVVADDHVYWADKSGVYRSDGASITDLTSEGGISDYWADLVATAENSVSLGFFRGQLFVNLVGDNDTVDEEVATFVCNVANRSWWRWANIMAYNFASEPGIADELYFSSRDTTGAKTVGAISPCFDSLNGSSDFSNSEPVLPVLTTPYYNLDKQTKKRWKHVYLTYHVHAEIGSPGISTTLMTALQADGDIVGTSLGGFDETPNARTRRRIKVGRSSAGVLFHMTLSAASDVSAIWALEADVDEQEGSRR